ncbi:MAG: DUF1707 domain-containing protein [Nocardia sp.]|nr:DUF1707 domain-containing protein [Nocardia sp.]
MGDRDLRVCDAEREYVGTLLQRAVGLGMLSLGEFTERMDTALAAKTRGELNAVLIDLPGIRLTGRQGQQADPGLRPGHPGSHSGPPPETLRPRMSSVVRKGPWQVPSRLRINSRMSSITLDFTQAIMSAQVVEIVIDDAFGALNLILPGAATVDLNGVELIGSGITNEVPTGPPIGPLHVVVRGRLKFGAITAKHPFGVKWNRIVQGGFLPGGRGPQG